MTTLHRPAKFVLAALTLSLLSAQAEKPLQQETESSYPLPPDGSIRIEAGDGSIQIYGWKESRVRVAALRNAYTAARLQQIEVATDPRPRAISVQALIPPARGIFADRSGTVDLFVNVPDTARLELKLVNGEISLQGLRGGSAHAELVNGKITALNCVARMRAHSITGALEVFRDWWENFPATYDFSVGYGTIRARFPEGAQFRVDAETANGHVSNEFGLKKPTTRGPGEKLEAATAADAPVTLHFRTDGGNISIDSFR